MSHARTLRTTIAVVLITAVASAAAQAPRPQAGKGPKRRGPPSPPPLVLQPADSDQLAAAGMTYLGPYECEFNEKVQVDASKEHAGYIDVHHRKRMWTMKPVLSKTGALRLEDVRGRMLMLQIANKSMVMDTQVGQRVVDNCVNEKHHEAMAAIKAAGGAESIGIDPVKAAAAASAAAVAASAAADAAAAAAVAASAASAAAAAASAAIAPTQGASAP